MQLSYIASQTSNLPVAKLFKSWGRVCNSLTKAGYNTYEIHALALSTRWLTRNIKVNPAPYTALLNFLKLNGYTPRCDFLNGMVMEHFGKKDKLELNEKGQVCRRGTMPGNYHPNKTILVPVGTPLSCDPTSETYWSM